MNISIEQIAYLLLSTVMMYIVWSSKKILSSLEDNIKELRKCIENVNKETLNTSKLVSVLLTEHYKNHPDSKIKDIL